MRKKHLFMFTLTTSFLIITLISCHFNFPSSALSDRSGTKTMDHDAISSAIEAESTSEYPSSTATKDTPLHVETEQLLPTATMTATEMINEEDEPLPDPTATQSSEPEPPVVYGPDNFPDHINPLTGMPVENTDWLYLPPALLSISNFPASARPQSGLNSSPLTFEIAIGEGMTRFLAMFYGSFPAFASGQTEGASPGLPSDSPEGLGPIRSGRMSYEGIRASYHGFLVMASAYSGVAQNLQGSTSIFGSDSDDINSALIGVDKLHEIALAQQKDPEKRPYLDGLMFAEKAPGGSAAADMLWVFYSNLNQIQWRYNPEIGANIRSDIKTDGSQEFVQSTDRLTGDPLTKENVIVMYVEHEFLAPTLIDINLFNIPPRKALLYRDGQVYEIFWTTRFGDEKETGLLRPIRFVDDQGNPFPLKPGQTWVHIVTESSYHVESTISPTPFHPIVPQEGTGLWLVRFRGQ